MEVRKFALTILQTPDLEGKLTPPPKELTDHQPGPPLRLTTPARTPQLAIVPARQTKVPPIEGMPDPAQRVRILHALANHELQAVELFAWALLAFPQTPTDFREGLVQILRDEQRHTRMYKARVEALGALFGDFPVSGYFWNKAEHMASPLDFVCAMSLTFENANLDHTVELAAAAHQAGDRKTAAVIEQVHRDEIEHVAFGWQWLKAWKGESSAWDTYRQSLTWPLRPAKARGLRFHRTGRETAGLDHDFIHHLEGSILDP
jgi:uncharacterized ferritin-like protein (DUF455 family)